MIKCRKRTCPCKDCPQVDACEKGCLECDRQGKTTNIGFCTITRRDGDLIYRVESVNKSKT